MTNIVRSTAPHRPRWRRFNAIYSGWRLVGFSRRKAFWIAWRMR